MTENIRALPGEISDRCPVCHCNHSWQLIGQIGPHYLYVSLGKCDHLVIALEAEYLAWLIKEQAKIVQTEG